jgi:hypothetical protein
MWIIGKFALKKVYKSLALRIFLISLLVTSGTQFYNGNFLQNIQPAYSSSQTSQTLSDSVQLSDSLQFVYNPSSVLNPQTFTITNTQSISYTVPAGRDKLLLVGVSLKGAQTFDISSISETSSCSSPSSQSLTDAGATEMVAPSGKDSLKTEFFYLASPPTGSVNFCVSLSGTPGANQKVVLGIITITGVNTINPIKSHAINSDGSGSTNPNIAITGSSYGDLAVDVVAMEGGQTNTNPTPTSPQTLQWVNSQSDLVGFGSSEMSLSDSTNFSWTTPISTPWAESAVDIRPMKYASLSDSLSIQDSLSTGNPAPSISSITAATPVGTGFVSGSTITVIFSKPTNQPFKIQTNNQFSQTDVNNLFSFIDGNNNPISIGASYTGTWLDPFTFVITIQNPGTVTANNLLNVLRIQVQGTAHLKDASLTSSDSTSISSQLSGSFEGPLPPFIKGFVADDPNNGPKTFHDGDEFSIKFSTDTNEPGGTGTLDKVGVDSLFAFNPTLGSADYSGQWVNPALFRITMKSVDTANPAVLGITTIQVVSTNLKNSAQTSPASTSTSSPLTGSFGTFTVSQEVGNGGTAIATLPSGVVAQITLPSTSSGTVTVEATTASNTASSGTIQFLGTPTEISPPPGACTTGCTFSFQFTDNDLKAAGISSPSDVKILHDHNNDGDFKDPGEVLTTTITPTTPPGPYTATATDTSTSKFAIGGVVAALAILGAGGGAVSAPPSLTSASIVPEIALPSGEFGGILTLSSGHLSDINVGEPVELKVDLNDTNGASFIQHVAFHTNFEEQGSTDQNGQTYIMYETGEPLAVFDPQHIVSNVTVNATATGNNLEVVFNMTFAKPMAQSDVVIRGWDINKVSFENVFHNVLEVTLPTPNSTSQILEPAKPTSPTNLAPQQSLNIPFWVKNNAAWWSDDKIGDSDFAKGIQYLIEQGIMKIPQTSSSQSSSQYIPGWIKNDAKWWSENQIGDSEFVKGIQYLITNGIIQIRY